MHNNVKKAPDDSYASNASQAYDGVPLHGDLNGISALNTVHSAQHRTTSHRRQQSQNTAQKAPSQKSGGQQKLVPGHKRRSKEQNKKTLSQDRATRSWITY